MDINQILLLRVTVKFCEGMREWDDNYPSSEEAEENYPDEGANLSYLVHRTTLIMWFTISECLAYD